MLNNLIRREHTSLQKEFFPLDGILLLLALATNYCFHSISIHKMLWCDRVFGRLLLYCYCIFIKRRRLYLLQNVEHIKHMRMPFVLDEKRYRQSFLVETSNSVENVLWSVMTFVIIIKRSHRIRNVNCAFCAHNFMTIKLSNFGQN